MHASSMRRIGSSWIYAQQKYVVFQILSVSVAGFLDVDMSAGAGTDRR